MSFETVFLACFLAQFAASMTGFVVLFSIFGAPKS